MRFADFVEINPRVRLNKGSIYPFVAMEIVTPGSRYVKTKTTREYTGGGGSKFCVGDTLFARITPCLENGKIAQFRWDQDQEGFGSTEFFVFRARDNVSIPPFVYYLASTEIIRGPAVKSMTGASGRQRAELKAIENIEIPLVTIPVQHKIASILSAYDDLIENNNRRIKILEEMAQAIYREWFVNFRFPGHEKVKMVTPSPLGRGGGEGVNNIGMIPEGWEVKKVGEILRKINRKPRIKKEDYLKEGDIPTIDQSTSFIGGLTNDIEALHETPLPIVVFGDHTRIVKYIDFPFASGADGTQLLYPENEELMPAYFFYAVNNIDLSNFAYARHFKFLKAQNILVPHNPSLKIFNDIAGSFLRQMSSLRKKNDNLRITRDLLLPKLISGEIDVEKIYA